MKIDITDNGYIKLSDIKNRTMKDIQDFIEKTSNEFGFKSLMIVNVEADCLILKPEEN